MDNRNLDGRETWARMLEINPHLTPAHLNSYWHVNSPIEIIAREAGVPYERVRDVLANYDPETDVLDG